VVARAGRHLLLETAEREDVDLVNGEETLSVGEEQVELLVENGRGKHTHEEQHPGPVPNSE